MRAAVVVTAATMTLTACTTQSLEQKRQAVAATALKAGEMPALNQANIKLAEQVGSRDPEYSIVAELSRPSLSAFISSARLNRSQAQAITVAAQDSLSGTLSPAKVAKLLDRADLHSYDADNSQVITDQVGSTYRIFNYTCANARCGVVIVVSTI